MNLALELKEERVSEDKLPRDFWENLAPVTYTPSLVRDQPGDIINYDSHNRLLNVKAKRHDSDGKSYYHVTITDNEVAFQALSKNRAALDSPGFIAGSRTFQDFDTAMKNFFAAHQKINELGY